MGVLRLYNLISFKLHPWNWLAASLGFEANDFERCCGLIAIALARATFFFGVRRLSTTHEFILFLAKSRCIEENDRSRLASLSFQRLLLPNVDPDPLSRMSNRSPFTKSSYSKSNEPIRGPDGIVRCKDHGRPVSPPAPSC